MQAPSLAALCRCFRLPQAGNSVGNHQHPKLLLSLRHAIILGPVPSQEVHSWPQRLPGKKMYYHHWRLLKGEVQFSGMQLLQLPVPLPTVRPCAQLGSMACVMAMSADVTFSEWHCAPVPI
jgi:hypothetical protein